MILFYIYIYAHIIYYVCVCVFFEFWILPKFHVGRLHDLMMTATVLDLNPPAGCTSKWGRGHASCVKLFRVVPPYKGKRGRSGNGGGSAAALIKKSWDEPAKISGHHGHGT